MSDTLIDIENNNTAVASATAEENSKPVNKGYTPEKNPERFVEFDGEKMEIPDNYWDEENKTANVGAILKSARDMRNQISDKSPKDGLYKITIPEDLKDKIAADPDSPLFKVAAAWAKEKKMSQEDFDRLTGIYLNDLAANVGSDEDFITEQKNALNKIYGKKTSEVVSSIENWLKNSGIQDKDIIDEISLLATTATGVKAIEWFMKQSKVTGNIMPSASGAAAPGTLSEDELKSLMQQPGYRDGTDRALMKKVEDGWKALYPDK